VFSLTIFADPPDPNAVIYLDGKKTGKLAPYSFSDLAEGKHTIELKTAEKAGRVTINGIDRDEKMVTVKLENIVPNRSKKAVPFKVTPDWIPRGSGYYHGAYGLGYYGVGTAWGIQNQKLLESTAENRARDEVYRLLKKDGIEKTNSITKSIRILSTYRDFEKGECTSLAVLSAKDAGEKANKETSLESAPQWAARGTGYYDGIFGLAYYGVGSASGIQNQKLLQKTAETRAENEVYRILKKRQGRKKAKSLKSSIRIIRSQRHSSREWFSLAVFEP
jgi:hypothetical protein